MLLHTCLSSWTPLGCTTLSKPPMVAQLKTTQRRPIFGLILHLQTGLLVLPFFVTFAVPEVINPNHRERSLRFLFLRKARMSFIQSSRTNTVITPRPVSDGARCFVFLTFFKRRTRRTLWAPQNLWSPLLLNTLIGPINDGSVLFRRACELSLLLDLLDRFASGCSFGSGRSKGPTLPVGVFGLTD